MRVLLINTPMSLTDTVYEYAEPLGVLYIGSYLSERGHDVRIKDYSVDRYDKTKLRELINNFSPEIVGISFMSASYNSANVLINNIRGIKPDIPIVVGGYHATAMPELTLKDMNVDVVVRGEGEITFWELAEVIDSKDRLESVKGISYRGGESIVHTPDRELVENLNELPPPKRELLHESKYPRFNIISSRGCPFHCIYCDRSISKGKIRFRSPENLIDEIKSNIKKFGNRPILFVDDHFFINKRRLFKFFDLLEKGNISIKWVCQSRVDSVSPEVLHRAKKAGCIQIMYGVETGDPDELEYINKQTTLEQAENAINWTKKAGITARANFMLGFPISGRSNIENTIRFAKKIMPDLVRFFIVKPFPNTTLWDRCIEQEVIPDIENVDWRSFSMREFGIRICKLSDKELTEYVGTAYLHLLKDRVRDELTKNFIKHLILFFREFGKTKKVTYSLIISFPSSINLFSELWFLIKHMPFFGKFRYLKRIYVMEKNLN